MQAIAGPFIIVCAVLAVAGAAKLLSPLPTARALQAAGLPHHLMAVRALGATELALAAFAVAAGGTLLPIAVGVLYLGFAGFIALMLDRERKGLGTASCGCFGVTDTPPGAIHLAANLVSATLALAAGLVGTDPIADILGDQPAAGVPYVAYLLLGTYLAYLVMTVLPEILQPKPSSEVAPSFAIRRPVQPNRTGQ